MYLILSLHHSLKNPYKKKLREILNISLYPLFNTYILLSQRSLSKCSIFNQIVLTLCYAVCNKIICVN